VICVFAFVLGILVTLAEPALKVMGQKVEETTHGRFVARTLILSVAFGMPVSEQKNEAPNCLT
jgi:hypothetical protein